MKYILRIIPVLFFAVTAFAQDKPNIVLILADDLGYGEMGCKDCGAVPTPFIDSIATNGIRFTDGYANHPVCAPSRAGLLTGRYQQRFGFEHNSGPEEYASKNFGLPRSEPIIAEQLKEAGYTTGIVGKWHLGFREGLRPNDRGFDFFYGFLAGGHTYLPERFGEQRYAGKLMRNGERVKGEKAYLTDAFARESLAFIERSKDQPFFLYLAPNAVHGPLEATSGYEQRFQDIDNPRRRTYAGMTAAMDDAVGHVLAKLRELGLEDNTLVFFYSDNGGPTRNTTSRNDPLRGFKGEVWEGGIRIPFMVQWPGKLPAEKVYQEMIMGFDVHATILAAAGIPLPDDKPLDGVNLIPYLTGQDNGVPHDRLFWRSGRQNYAARMGEWKLVRETGGKPELYNLQDDIGETRDLAKAEPEVMQRLQAAYAEWDSQMTRPKWIRQTRENAEVGGKLKR